ncbi:hypothetical protein PVNG_02355 [Plasmodium vivax North Korean]|uniref:HD domain-containing protein n=1 Tax=Plasmodium vivax North Korean TaxID=1035514 RepID=A0A0J9TN82_PLAVI|nr:hypothetical protein PVNG_02355 [Plasmodium vivax North Korean]
MEREQYSSLQTLLDHSLQVAEECSKAAEILGLDSLKAGKLGLLHDIGKIQEPYYMHATSEALSNLPAPKDADISMAISSHHNPLDSISSAYVSLVAVVNKIISQNHFIPLGEDFKKFTPALQTLLQSKYELKDFYSAVTDKNILIIFKDYTKKDQIISLFTQKREELVSIVQSHKQLSFEKLLFKSIYNLKLPKNLINHLAPSKRKFQIELDNISSDRKKIILSLLDKEESNSIFLKELTGFSITGEPNYKSKKSFSVHIDNPKEPSKLKPELEKLSIASCFYQSLVLENISPEKLTREYFQQRYDLAAQDHRKKVQELGKDILINFLSYPEEKATEELSYIIGKTKFIFSFSQNLLEHLLEVSILSANFAYQIGIDVVKAKRAGFFHDIGKVSNKHTDHVPHGEQLAIKFNLENYIVETIQLHHEHSHREENPYLNIVKSMDKFSAGRVGARPNQIENTKNRNEELKTILLSFEEIQDVEFMAGGHVIKLNLKMEKFEFKELENFKNRIVQKIKESSLKYQYNYQFVINLNFNDSFLFEEYLS